MLLVFISLNTALAQNGNYGTKEVQQATGDSLPSKVAGEDNVSGVIGKVVQAMLGIIGIVFFLLILSAGFNWMIAQGNVEKVDKAKDTVTGAAIGLVIVMAAYAITNFVLSNLGKQ